MTNNTGFVYFDEAVVRRTNDFYKILLEEEEVTIFKKVSLVDEIVSKTGEDENLIAILLAQIEYVRSSNAQFGKRGPRKIEDDKTVQVLSILLEDISIEELIYKVKSSNWYELVNVFESGDPIKNIEEL